jgi:exodeoxyribonuclease V gamma subunit
MLQLLQSNSMTTLVDVFCTRTRAQVEDPFEPSIVLVQSYGIGQWLKFQTAERAGIAANMDCQLPADFIWQVYQWLLPGEQLSARSYFQREQLTWHVMQCLASQDSAVFAPIQHYLAGTGDPQLRRFQLSAQIADLYDQYLVYRPDWIARWESGQPGPLETQPWQAPLWRRLRAGTREAHRADLHQQLLAVLAQLAAWPDSLPQRISIFGLSALPPMHLETFQALGQWLEVDIYFLNPCAHYWGDILSEKDLARRSIRQLSQPDSTAGNDDYLEVGNPLLSSMGKQGREFFELLLEADAITSHEVFLPRTQNTALAALQNDVLNMTYGGVFQGNGADNTPGQLRIDSTDPSIQIHSCHSKMREIEILFDQLLGIFAARPDIKPSQVIVMTPDIAEYAAYIQAVFKDQMYYALADRGLSEESSLLLAFETLLALPESRLTSTEIMDLLEVPAIARKLALTEADLLSIATWIKATNIRWEFSGEEKQTRWQLPATQANTWTFGLERLLLGYAMAAEEGLYQDRLPFDVAADEAELLGKLCAFIHLLQSYRQRLAIAQNSTSWLATVNQLILDFFAPAGDEELDIDAVRESLLLLVDQTTSAALDQPISARLLRHWLNAQLAQPRPARGFLSGGITFATLVPMRSIPFKVVCLLGMNDSAYPRKDTSVSFNLMASAPYVKGDRSRRIDDRYLFLEALLAAEDYLYISYEGRSVKTNKIRPPSVLVSELTHYLQAVFNRDFVTEHPLQPFSAAYFDARRPELRSFQGRWYDALRAGTADQLVAQHLATESSAQSGFIDRVLADDPLLLPTDIQQLQQFLRNPARYYLNQRLGIYFPFEEAALSDAEPFSLDPLTRYDITDQALSALIEGEPLDRWRDQLTASGRLMPGALGQQALTQQLARAEQVYQALDSTSLQRLSANLNLQLPSEPNSSTPPLNLTLSATIDNLQGAKVLHYRAATQRRRQTLGAWVTHLFLNALDRGPFESQLISLGTNNKLSLQYLQPLAPSLARQHLTSLVQLYLQGLRQPLCFLPELSGVWYDAHRGGKSASECLDKVFESWQSDQPGAESTDPAIKRLFDFPADAGPAFTDIATRVYGPLMDCLEKTA